MGRPGRSPRPSKRSFPFRTKAVVRPGLDGDLSEVDPEGAGDVGAHLLDMRTKFDRTEHHERVDVDNLVPRLLDVVAELIEEVETPSILCVRIIFGKVGAEIAVGDRPRQGIDQGVAQDVAIGMCAEADWSGDRHATQHQRFPWVQPMNIVSKSGPGVRHWSVTFTFLSRVSTSLASAMSCGELERVARCTVESEG